MPTVYRITTPSELETAINALIENPHSIIPEISDDLILTIKVEGRSWDGLIDIRVAKYVTELQRTFDRACRATGAPAIQQPGLVKVKIKPGSTDLQTRAADLFEKLVLTMNEEHKFILCLAIVGCVTGVFMLRQVLAHLNAKHQRQIENDRQNTTVTELSQSLRLALEKIDPDRPARVLVKDLAEEDRIALAADAAPIPRADAAARYPRRTRITPIDVKIDDTYEVESVSLENPAQLQLRKADITLKAELSLGLSDGDRDRFIAEVKSAIESGRTMRVSFQIDARVGERVQMAIVVAVAQPSRPDAQDLADLLS